MTETSAFPVGSSAARVDASIPVTAAQPPESHRAGRNGAGGGSGQAEGQGGVWKAKRWPGLGSVLERNGVSESTQQGPFYGNARLAKLEAARRNEGLSS